VKTAIEKLIDVGVKKETLLAIEGGVLSDDSFAKMHTWQDPKNWKSCQGGPIA